MVLGAFACGGEAPSDVIVLRPGAPPIPPATECVITITHDPAGARDHRDPCSAIDYPVHPPSVGPHYAIWADFGTYTDPVPSGFLVHSLEHGAVELLHNCESPCPEVLAAFDAIALAKTDDTLCRDHPAGSRIIIAPDPALDVPFAAVAWEHTYRATCLDEESLTAFVDEHYAQAPEDLCVPGTTTPSCP
jgi:hypothetical protein